MLQRLATWTEDRLDEPEPVIFEGPGLMQPIVVEPTRDQANVMPGAPPLEVLEQAGCRRAATQVELVDLGDREPEDLRVPRHEGDVQGRPVSLEPHRGTQSPLVT